MADGINIASTSAAEVPTSVHSDHTQLLQILMGVMDDTPPHRSSRFKDALDIIMPRETIPAMRARFLEQPVQSEAIDVIVKSYETFFLSYRDGSFLSERMYSESMMGNSIDQSIATDLAKKTHDLEMSDVFSRESAAVAFEVLRVAPHLCLTMMKFQAFFAHMVNHYHSDLTQHNPELDQKVLPAINQLRGSILMHNTHFFGAVLLTRLALCHYQQATLDGRNIGDVTQQDMALFVKNYIDARVFVKSMPTQKHPHAGPRVCPAHAHFRAASRATSVSDMWASADGWWLIHHQAAQRDTDFLSKICTMFANLREAHAPDIQVALPRGTPRQQPLDHRLVR